MQKSFIVLYFCFHVTIILFHATFFSLYSVAASSTISVCPTEAYHFIGVNNMIIDLFIEANKMDWVSTTLHLFMLKNSVCLLKNIKSAVSQRHSMIQTKKIFRITLMKDRIAHAGTHTQCGSNGRKSGYNNVDHHFPKFFLVHKI